MEMAITKGKQKDVWNIKVKTQDFMPFAMHLKSFIMDNRDMAQDKVKSNGCKEQEEDLFLYEMTGATKGRVWKQRIEAENFEQAVMAFFQRLGKENEKGHIGPGQILSIVLVETPKKTVMSKGNRKLLFDGKRFFLEEITEVDGQAFSDMSRIKEEEAEAFANMYGFSLLATKGWK